MTVPAGTPATVTISNLGGIETLETTIPPGVTILSGENATNRTSFLRSIAAALGADRAAATLKSDTEAGEVTVTMGETTATRTYSSTDGAVVRGGDPMSDRAELVDTYAALFATNPARTAVRNGGDGLREILMRGVDTAAINAEIRSLKQERASLEGELDRIETVQQDLPELRERERALESELAAVEADVESVQAEIDEYETTSEQIRDAERRLEELEELRERRRRTEAEIDETESSIETYEDELAAIEAELAELSVAERQIEELNEERRRVATDISALQSTIADLNDIIANNRSILEGEDVIGVFDSDDDVTADLHPETSTVRCWTCGSEVERSRIDGRIETLETVRTEKNDQLQELRAKKADLTAELRSIEDEKERRERLEAERRETKTTIEAERSALESLRADLQDLEQDIETAEDRVAETEALRDSDLPDAYQRLSRLQHRRGQLETRLASVREEIADIEEQIARKESIEEQLATVTADLETARGTIERTEREIVEKFNDQMADVIDRLDYDNIARVWIERIAAEESTSTAFDIHLVRESADGTVYEDTLESLSESEREVIGIVLSLSGYLVHDLDETVPMVLFDSVESIDATRLERLFEYVNEYAPFLITALLPEEASAIDRPTIAAPDFERQSA
ncbi:MAG: archaea-specific SMC-related protein [Halobacteriota archaeon]